MASRMEKDAAAKTLGAYLKTGGRFRTTSSPRWPRKMRKSQASLAGHKSLTELPENQRGELRTAIYLTTETIGKLSKNHKFSDSEAGSLLKYKTALDKTTKLFPCGSSSPWPSRWVSAR